MPAQDVAFTGSWELTTPAEYEVSYVYMGDVPAGASDLPETLLYEYNSKVEVAPDAAAPGYDFNGWATTDTEVKDGSFIMPPNAVVFEGSFTPRLDTEYKVEFYYEDYFGEYPATTSDWVIRTGETDSIASVSEMDKIPQKEGYTDGYAYDQDAPNIEEGPIYGDGSLVLKLYFNRQYYGYTVTEHFEGNRDVEYSEISHEGTAIFGDSILERSGVQVLQNMEKNGHTYTLIGVEGAYGDDGLVTSDPALNHVDIYYALDEIGGGEDPNKPDDVPDKYQLVFTYVSADPTIGNVTGKTVEVKTFTDEAGNYIDVQPTSPVTMDGHGPVPEGNSGYAFAYWTVQGGDENVRDYTKDMSHTLGQATYIEDTVFEATFLEDKGGTENPDTPDGKPDIYQIKFTYVTEDPQRGTFNGVNEVSEVLNRPTNDDGSTNMDAGVKPTVGVTITENGRYRFDHWTDPAGTEYTTEELQNAAFTTDTTFTAHFRYISSSGNGGGSSSGGGGGNPYNPSTGGPGEVLIDEGNVPLAPLPTEGTGTTIYDGDVPLAPLPKTGQQSSKTPVMMLLTGLFMAFAALTRRKEEKQ